MIIVTVLLINYNPCQTNVVEWLDSLGLAQYLGRFVTAGYEGKSDVASLVSVDSNVLRHEIRVTKPGTAMHFLYRL